MTNDTIRNHLRAALEAVVSAEKARLHKQYDESDAAHAVTVELMKPIYSAIAALRDELEQFNAARRDRRDVRTLKADTQAEIKISFADLGHVVSIRFDTTSLSMSARASNSTYTIDEYVSLSSTSINRTHTDLSAEDALELVVERVGKHVALYQAGRERSSK